METQEPIVKTYTEDELEKLIQEKATLSFKAGADKTAAELAALNEQIANYKNELFDLKTKPEIKKAYLDNNGNEDFFEDFLLNNQTLRTAEAGDYGKLIQENQEKNERFFKGTSVKTTIEHEPQSKHVSKRIPGTIYKR